MSSVAQAYHNKLLLARALCTRLQAIAGSQFHHCLQAVLVHGREALQMHSTSSPFVNVP